MANVLEHQIVEDGWRNAVVKLTGVLDTSDASETPAVALADFTNNDKGAGTLVGFRVDRLDFAVGDGLEVQLLWESSNPQMIVAIAGRGKIDHWLHGGWQPDRTRANYSGNINLTTTGFGLQGPGTQNFTVTLELIKLYS